ncbi:PA216 protein, partial [Atractosteus spatula]|nr:PA216 protein [Atractosteus spatula]
MSGKGKKPEVGDIISFNRGLYSHWGIYFGNENGKDYIVHLCGGQSNSKPASIQSTVKKDELNAVAGKSSYEVFNYLDKSHTPKKPEKIKADLNDSIGKKMEYNPFKYNCQSYASQMRYDVMKTPEGEKAEKFCTDTLQYMTAEMDHFSPK